MVVIINIIQHKRNSSAIQTCYNERREKKMYREKHINLSSKYNFCFFRNFVNIDTINHSSHPCDGLLAAFTNNHTHSLHYFRRFV